MQNVESKEVAKSPLKRLLQGAGFSCGALVVGILFGLFLTPYMLASLGEKAYGIYVVASLFAGWCGLLDFGLTTTTSRYVSKVYAVDDRRGVDEIGSTAIVLFGGISALVFLAACAAFGIALLGGENFADASLLGTALFLAGASFAVSKISDGFCGVLRGAFRQELTGGTTFLFRIVFGVVNFAILFCGGRVVALLVGNFVLTLLQLIVWVALVRVAVPTFRFSPKNFRKKRARTLFEYGFFAFLAQAGEMAVERSDLVVIAALMSMNDVARYNLVVVTLSSYFASFVRETSSWQTNWFARLAALDETNCAAEAVDEKRVAAQYGDEFYRSRAAVGRASIYFSLFLAFEILALGPAFIERWIGAEYLDVFPALALVVAANGLYRGSAETNSRILQGTARHRILALGSILHGVVNAALSVLFIELGFGLFGVALGLVLPGVAIWYCWIPNATCRLIGEKRRTYWARQIKTTAIGIAACVGPFWLARRFAAPNYATLIVLAGVCASCYFAFVYLFGTTRAEKEKSARFVATFWRRIVGR